MTDGNIVVVRNASHPTLFHVSAVNFSHPFPPHRWCEFYLSIIYHLGKKKVK